VGSVTSALASLVSGLALLASLLWSIAGYVFLCIIKGLGLSRVLSYIGSNSKNN
jgi:hypothetical protein